MRKSTPVVSSGEVASYDSVSRQTIVSPVRHLARGEIYTVRYEAVNAMLLNEFLKAHRKLDQQQAMIDRQQKQIEALTAAVQKVSNQVALGKPAPQLVANPQIASSPRIPSRPLLKLVHGIS
jgi:hypothetical protein